MESFKSYKMFIYFFIILQVGLTIYNTNMYSILSLIILLLALFIANIKQQKLQDDIKTKEEAFKLSIKEKTEHLKETTVFLRTLFETIPTPVFYKNLDGIYLECNEEFAAIKGYKKEDIIGKQSKDIFSNKLNIIIENSDDLIENSNKVYNFETIIKLPQDDKNHIFSIYKIIVKNRDKVEGIIGFMLDITQKKLYQKNLENAIKKIQKQQQNIEKDFDIIQEYTIYSKSDLSWSITEVSNALLTISGYNKHDLIGNKHTIFQRKHITDKLYIPIIKKLSKAQIWEGEFLNYRKNGKQFWTRTKIQPDLDENGVIIGFTTFSQDISNETRIREHSQKDELTQIYNRRKFNEELHKALVYFSRYKNDISLILFDIDFFKLVNDKYGHLVGDKILIKIADIVSENIRETDIFARWGGEEFTLILPNTDKQDAIKIAEKIRGLIINYDFEIYEHITCSFGVTAFKKQDNDLTIIKRVDDMLYEAKKTGRDKIIY